MSMVSREFPARLINVHDGDTVRCDIDLGFAVSLSNVSCRLLGINAPELKAPGGVEAKEHLIKLLANVEHMAITASPADWRDKYGRCLVTIWKGGLNINQKMLEDGFAMPMEMFAHHFLSCVEN